MEIMEVKVRKPRQSRIANTKYFLHKNMISDDGQMMTTVDDITAFRIQYYLITNQYIDINRKVTQKYKDDAIADSLAPMLKELKYFKKTIHQLVQKTYKK